MPELKRYRKLPVVIEAFRYDGTHLTQAELGAINCPASYTESGDGRRHPPESGIRGDAFDDPVADGHPDIFEKTYEPA